MENLFISPDPANHDLGIVLYYQNGSLRTMLVDLLKYCHKMYKSWSKELAQLNAVFNESFADMHNKLIIQYKGKFCNQQEAKEKFQEWQDESSALKAKYEAMGFLMWNGKYTFAFKLWLGSDSQIVISSDMMKNPDKKATAENLLQNISIELCEDLVTI